MSGYPVQGVCLLECSARRRNACAMCLAEWWRHQRYRCTFHPQAVGSMHPRLRAALRAGQSSDAFRSMPAAAACKRNAVLGHPAPILPAAQRTQWPCRRHFGTSYRQSNRSEADSRSPRAGKLPALSAAAAPCAQPVQAPPDGADALDELTQKGQQLENFKIT